MANLTIYYLTSVEERDKFLRERQLQTWNFTSVQDFEALDAARITLREARHSERYVLTGQEVFVSAFRWQLIQPEFRDFQNNVEIYRDGKLYKFDSDMKPLDGFWNYDSVTSRLSLDLL